MQPQGTSNATLLGPEGTACSMSKYSGPAHDMADSADVSPYDLPMKTCTPRVREALCAAVPLVCRRTMHIRVLGGSCTEAQPRTPRSVTQRVL